MCPCPDYGRRRKKVQPCHLYFNLKACIVTFEKSGVTFVMQLIQLEDHLKLGIAEIDSQHEKLIALINRLHEALVGGAEKAVRDGLLSQLSQGTRDHCAYEEKLMLQYGYPEYQAHKSEHDRLMHNLADLIKRYRNGELVLSIAVVMELECWATIHIEKSDKPLGTFLIDQKGF